MNVRDGSVEKFITEGRTDLWGGGGVLKTPRVEASLEQPSSTGTTSSGNNRRAVEEFSAGSN
jgi:hypothetical protein